MPIVCDDSRIFDDPASLKTMEWHDEIQSARTGNKAAAERAREYLTPFAHGVLVTHTTPTNANILVNRVLDEAMKNRVLPPKDIGAFVVATARALGKQSKGEPDAGEAASTVKSWLVPDEQREILVLRLLEGIGGPEIAAVLNLPVTEVRAALRLGVAAISGTPANDDQYVWEMLGAPNEFMARMETLLPSIRYEAVESTNSVVPDLRPHTNFSADEPTNSDATAVPAMPTVSVNTVKPAATVLMPAVGVKSEAGTEKRNAEPSPFDQPVFTIAASDLPAAAQTQPLPTKRANSNSNLGTVKPGSAPTKERPEVRFENDATGAQLPPALARAPSQLSLIEDEDPSTAVEAKIPTRAEMKESATKPTMIRSRSNPNMTPLRPNDSVASLTPVSEFKQLTQGYAPFFLAGIFVLGAAGMTWAYVSAVERNSKSSWTLLPVLVATQDLAEGTVLVPEFVAQRSVPASQAGSDGNREQGGMAGSNTVKPEQIGFIINQRLAVPVQQGDPLFFSQFISARTKEHLSTKVFSKMRAINIAVGLTQSVANFVKPGDQVDLVANYKEGSEEGAPMIASTVVQNVTVIATGQISGTTPEAALTDKEKRYGNVTLLVLPEEAEAITLGATLGRINLSLRNEKDDERIDAFDGKKTNAKSLISGERQKQLEFRRRNTITIIRGNPSQQAPSGLK